MTVLLLLLLIHYAMSQARSPYSPNVGPFQISLLHATRRVVVRGLDYGMVGAPFPDRRVVVGDETGWEDNGMFVVDESFPRKTTINIGNYNVPAFVVGPRWGNKIVVFRYAAMDIGHVVDGPDGPYGMDYDKGVRGFVVERSIECALPFGGLEKEDFEGGSAPVSTAAWRAMSHA